MPRSNQPRSPGSTLLLMAAILFGVTGAHAQQMDGWPDWIKAEMARETPKLKSREVTAADGRYRFQLAGTPAEPGEFDGGWYFESDIDARVPLECYLFTDDADLATLVVNVAELSIEANAEANGGPVANRDVFAIDAGAIEGAPYLSLEWVYTVGAAPKALVGFTKVRAAIQGDIVLACAHNYLGYRDTFATAFATFVRSAQQPQNSQPPYYEEIAVQNLNGKNIGITRVNYARHEQGNSMIHMTSASLVPVGPGAVSSNDSSTVSWSTPAGEIISVFTADAENGELVNDMRLDRNEDGDWVSSGTFQSKEIMQVIDGSQQPLSEIGQMRIVKTLFEGEETQALFPLYISNADPTQFLEGKLLRGAPGTGRRGKLILGPITFDAEFDEDGSLINASINMGAAEMTIDRVWTRGKPW